MRALIRIAALSFPLALLGTECTPRPWTNPHQPLGTALFASPQVNPIVVVPDGSRVYVANTAGGVVNVIDTAARKEIARIRVGIDPVGLALRPDGLELWVSNHVSDSVSVIDTDPGSPTYHEIRATIQDLVNGVTDFDEPVGIAFASNTKAYVALSSRNEIAIVDIAGSDYTISPTRLAITAQDPRAIAVRNGRLYVAAFESGNQSELSVCAVQGSPGDTQCTFGAAALTGVGTDPNLPGVPKNVVRDPDVPDRDLFVFDTTTDQLVAQSPVDGVGTLLYGLAVSSGGTVYVTNTDARNADVDDQGSPDGNGLAAPAPWGQSHTLADLDNRIFRNRITRLDCAVNCAAPVAFDLEEPPGSPVATPLATPYGIAITGDDSRLVVTAAASDRVALLQEGTPGLAGVLDSVDVGSIPRGIALHSAPGQATGTAYVLNTLGNSVSILSVAPWSLTRVGSVAISGDRTPEDVRLGRIAFNTASASSSGTFACASCHPDGNTDQLLWVIGASCDDCDQEEMRSTMPVRGLDGTLPLHWDGTLGDPFGGPNGEIGVGANEGTLDCSLAGGQDACFRHLVNASLSGVMCDQPSCPDGPSGLPGLLGDAERDQMAVFLQSVAYPPARMRPIDDVVSASALDGFADFFMDQGGNGGSLAQTCADSDGGCHALPLGVSTNSVAVGAFEAPTMRGMTDRFLHFSGGFTAPQEVLDLVAFAGFGVIPWDPNEGLDELVVFSAGFPGFNPAYNVLPDDMFQMFEEASTGPSGATGRMVTLDADTTTGASQAATYALLDALEAADARGVVNVYGEGVYAGVVRGVSYKADLDLWQVGSFQLTRAQLEQEAESGNLRATVIAHLPMDQGRESHPNPLLDVTTVGSGPNGDPDIPRITSAGGGDNPMSLVGIDVRADASVLLDGQVANASVACVGGSFTPFCSSELVEITLLDQPADGLHLLQVQNGDGPISPELPVCVGTLAGCE